MGIDGIGKGGRPPITGTPDGTSGASELDKLGKLDKADKVDKPFSVERPDASQIDRTSNVAGTDAASAASPLDRLRAGEIDVHGYMDLKVNEATRGLESSVPKTDLDEIKRALRDQMATDPNMADLVRTATGHMPKPPED